MLRNKAVHKWHTSFNSGAQMHPSKIRSLETLSPSFLSLCEARGQRPPPPSPLQEQSFCAVPIPTSGSRVDWSWPGLKGTGGGRRDPGPAQTSPFPALIAASSALCPPPDGTPRARLANAGPAKQESVFSKERLGSWGKEGLAGRGTGARGRQRPGRLPEDPVGQQRVSSSVAGRRWGLVARHFCQPLRGSSAEPALSRRCSPALDLVRRAVTRAGVAEVGLPLSAGEAILSRAGTAGGRPLIGSQQTHLPLQTARPQRPRRPFRRLCLPRGWGSAGYPKGPSGGCICRLAPSYPLVAGRGVCTLPVGPRERPLTRSPSSGPPEGKGSRGLSGVIRE